MYFTYIILAVPAYSAMCLFLKMVNLLYTLLLSSTKTGDLIAQHSKMQTPQDVSLAVC